MISKTILETIADDRFRAVCDGIISDMNRLPVMGAAIGIWHEGREYTAGFGVTNVDHPLPVTDETMFQVGSISKTFTATAVMRLVETGKIDLDKPIRSYYPELKLKDEAVAQKVTMRHLLTHSGGWDGDYFNDFGIGDDALTKLVEKLADLPMQVSLGKIFSYNNMGFALAGKVIEIVTGKTCEEALKELVFEPLGLAKTFFFPHDILTHRFAVGHEVWENEVKVARPWAVGRGIHPVGGITCSVKELLRYARFHIGDGIVDGNRILSTSSIKMMQTPALTWTNEQYVGLSWNIVHYGETATIGHGGATKGFLAQLRIVPSRDFAIAMLTNTDRGGLLNGVTIANAMKTFLGLELPQIAPIEVSAEKQQECVGSYANIFSRNEIKIVEGKLQLTQTQIAGFPTPETPLPPPTPPMNIAFYASDKIVVLDGALKDAHGEFLRDDNGKIKWFRIGARAKLREN
jgi:CubicO group peptidase (beta-lactamase class C family)